MQELPSETLTQDHKLISGEVCVRSWLSIDSIAQKLIGQKKFSRKFPAFLNQGMIQKFFNQGPIRKIMNQTLLQDFPTNSSELQLNGHGRSFAEVMIQSDRKLYLIQWPASSGLISSTILRLIHMQLLVLLPQKPLLYSPVFLFSVSVFSQTIVFQTETSLSSKATQSGVINRCFAKFSLRTFSVPRTLESAFFGWFGPIWPSVFLCYVFDSR